MIFLCKSIETLNKGIKETCHNLCFSSLALLALMETSLFYWLKSPIFINYGISIKLVLLEKAKEVRYVNQGKGKIGVRVLRV